MRSLKMQKKKQKKMKNIEVMCKKKTINLFKYDNYEKYV